MENIINVFCSGIEKTRILKIPFDKIEVDLDNRQEFLNVRITSKQSLFKIPFDIFCIFRDAKFHFSLSEISIGSDNINGSMETINTELCKYLAFYFKSYENTKMSLTRQMMFNFRHNLKIENCTNSYFVFYEKYMKNFLICVDNYDKKASADCDSLVLFNDIIKIRLNCVFYATILPILPIDVLLNLLKTNLPTDVLIFLLYKAYKIHHTKYPKISYAFLVQILRLLKCSLNFDLSDQFQELASNLVKQRNWLKYISIEKHSDGIQWYRRDTKPIEKYSSDEKRILHQQNKSIEEYDNIQQRIPYQHNKHILQAKNQIHEIEIKSGNDITKEIGTFDKMEMNFVSDAFFVITKFPIFVNAIIVECNGTEHEICIYKEIIGKEKVLVDLSQINNKDKFVVTKLIWNNKTLFMQQEFVCIKKEIQIVPKIFQEVNFRIYKISTKHKILYEGYKKKVGNSYYLYCKNNTKNRLLYKIQDNFYEKITLS